MTFLEEFHGIPTSKFVISTVTQNLAILPLQNTALYRQKTLVELLYLGHCQTGGIDILEFNKQKKKIDICKTTVTNIPVWAIKCNTV